MEDIGYYFRDIRNITLLTADEERDLAQQIEEGAAAREKITRFNPEIIERVGRCAVLEAEGFLNDDERITDPLAFEASPYVASLQDLVSAVNEIKPFLDLVDNADEAKTRFILANTKLVVSIARRYPLGPGISLGDLVQVGNLGLEHAVDKFDWRRGLKFSTYATFWIRKSILKYLDSQSSIKYPPRKHQELRTALQNCEREHEAQLTPELQDFKNKTQPASLDKLSSDGKRTLSDTIASHSLGPEEQIFSYIDKGLLRKAVMSLPRNERIAIEMHYGLYGAPCSSFVEIAAMLGISDDSARRLAEKAYPKLRRHLESMSFV